MSSTSRWIGILTAAFVSLSPMKDAGAETLKLDLPDTPAQDMCDLKAHDCYIPLYRDVGIQAHDYSEYLKIADAISARNWDFGYYFEQDQIKEVPDELHTAAVFTYILTGAPPSWMVEKAYAESSFRGDVTANQSGDLEKAVGWYQLKPDAVIEALYFAGQHEHAEIFRRIMPQIDWVDRSLDENDHFVYSIADGKRDEILEMRTHALFSSLLDGVRSAHYLAAMAARLEAREISSIDAYWNHQKGMARAIAFITGKHDPLDKPAYSMYANGAESDEVTGNWNVYFDDQGQARSFVELDSYLEEERKFRNFPIFRDGDFIHRPQDFEVFLGEAAQKRLAEITTARAVEEGSPKQDRS